MYANIHGALALVNWPEPDFTDNVNVTSVIRNLSPGTSLPVHTYHLHYEARDAENNHATCSFTLHVRGKHPNVHIKVLSETVELSRTDTFQVRHKCPFSRVVCLVETTLNKNPPLCPY